MRQLKRRLPHRWVQTLILIIGIVWTCAMVAITLIRSENNITPCYSPNNIRGNQTICREIDPELGVVCYWIEGRDDISCVPLNQTSYKEERSER